MTAAKEIARLVTELGQLRDSIESDTKSDTDAATTHDNAMLAQSQRAVKLLAGIESAMADFAKDFAEALQVILPSAAPDNSEAFGELIKAVKALKFEVKAPTVEFKVPAQPTPNVVNNLPALNVANHLPPMAVTVEAARQWLTIEVTQRRYARTGEIEAYRVDRIE